MADPTGICNRAIGHLGGITKNSRMTSMSRSAATTNAQHACLDFYDEAREEMLAYMEWPRARKYIALTVSDDDPLMDGQWTYKYARPADCLIVHAVCDDSGNEYEWEEVTEEVSGVNHEFIYANIEDAMIRYTFRVVESRYNVGMSGLHSMILAEKIAMTVVGDEKKLSVITTKLHNRVERLMQALGAKEGYVAGEHGEASVTGVFE